VLKQRATLFVIVPLYFISVYISIEKDCFEFREVVGFKGSMPNTDVDLYHHRMLNSGLIGCFVIFTITLFNEVVIEPDTPIDSLDSIHE
jgi:hypothetical protein